MKHAIIMTSKQKSILSFALIVVLVIMITVLALYKYLSFQSSLDLAVFSQAFWSTLHGKFFWESIDIPLYKDPSLYKGFFSVHMAPILAILLPFFAIYPHPVTLIVANVILHVLAALVLYKLSVHELGSASQSLAFVAIFLLNPLVWYTATYDFHLESFVPLFTLLQFYYLSRKRYGLAVFSAIALCLSIEAGPTIALLNAIYHLIRLQREKAGISLRAVISTLFITIFSVAWFIYAIRYPGGDILSDAIPPLKILNKGNLYGAVEYSLMRILSYDSIIYVLVLFGPLLFLPIRAPLELLPAIPWLLVSVLRGPLYTAFQSQYSSIIIAQLYIASIYALKKSGRHNLKGLVVAVLVANLLLNPGIHMFLQTQASVGNEVYKYEAFSDEHIEALKEAISLIPKNASVYTQGNLLPYLYNRLELYTVYDKKPYNFKPQYILVDTMSQFSGISSWIPWYSEPPVDTLRRALEDGYHLAYFKEGIYLLTLDKPTFRIIENSLTIYPQELYGGQIYWDPKGVVRVSEDGAWIYGPYIALLPGNYSVTWFFNVIVNGTARFDVSIEEGNTIVFKECDLSNDVSNFTLHFELKELTPYLEFRIIPKDLNLVLELERVEVRELD